MKIWAKKSGTHDCGHLWHYSKWHTISWMLEFLCSQMPGKGSEVSRKIGEKKVRD